MKAIQYLDLGFSIIPLGTIRKDANGSKVIEYPKDGWKKYQTQRATKEEVLSWAQTNLGIVTGRISNLLVLDTDSYKPGYDKALVQSFKLPITPVQQTASGGKQYFFKYPMDIDIHNAVCIGHEGSGIDIRGDGGMVIAPPSKTSYGEYTWLVSPLDCPVADVPPVLLELLRKQHSNESKVKKTLPELMGLKEGEGRDNAMTVFAGTLIQAKPRSTWESEVFPAMVELNKTYTPPLSLYDLKRIFNSISGKQVKSGVFAPEPPVPVQYTGAMSFYDLMECEFPKARYAIEPFFESGTLNMISAPPNTWKSWLLFYFASHIAKGTKVLDKFETEESKVLIVNEEDSSRAVQDRFKMLGIKDKKLPIYFHIAKGLKIDEKFVTSVIDECKEKGIGVVMIDSLRSAHLADENSSTAMQEVLDQLKKITREGITVIFTHHNRKKGPFDKSDSAELSRGSTAINAAISGHISLEEDIREGDKFLIIRHLKSKAGKKEDAVEVEINNEEEDKIRFVYKGKFNSDDSKALHAKEGIIELLELKEWMSIKEMIGMKIAGRANILDALKLLSKEKRIKTVTRKVGLEKGLNISKEGSMNEVFYSLGSEEVVVNDYIK